MRPPLLLLCFGLLTVVLAGAQALTGSALSPADLLASVTGTADATTAAVFTDLRLPRVAVGLLAGACLGVAGCLLQATLRNPLASPEVTGVGSGAVLGAVVATVLGGPASDPVALVLLAVAGGTAGGGVLWLVAARAGGDAVRTTVLGVLVSAVLAGITLVLLTAKPQLAGSMTRWLVGSLSGRTWEHWTALWPVALAAAAAAVVISPVVDLLRVDDDHALALGVHLPVWRPVVLAVAVLATAAAVASVGALVFVGLLAPHLARTIAGGDHRLAVPVAGLAGAATVALADTLAQAAGTLLPAVDGQRPGVPAGAVTALLGAVVMIRIAQRRSAAVAVTTGGGPT
ncbi:FecCD family ABC transporter permease [Amycolatopsis suaedae]|nr:iron ABC transporter permease [Amycolatopsis suaedae]